jgi:microcystin-dependent protein
MPLETATFIADLVVSNPPTSDLETQGANHLQLIKTVLQNTFGATVRRLVGLPTIVSISANTSVAANQGNTTFLVSTAGGAVTLTLPNNTLASTDAGWEIGVVKTTTDVNPIFLAPFSGTIQSGEYTGLTKTRRCIPGRRTRVIWTGSGFIAERTMPHPISSMISYTASKTLPVGFEWPNGQVLSSAANYPDYFALVGSGATPDLRGRADFGQDDMGGVAANRITVAGGNFDGTILNNVGGLQNRTMLAGDLASHFHAAFSGTETHAHATDVKNNGANGISVGGGPACTISGTQNVTSSLVNPGITIRDQAGGLGNANQTAATGNANPFTIMNPSLVCPKLLVVE